MQQADDCASSHTDENLLCSLGLFDFRNNLFLFHQFDSVNHFNTEARQVELLTVGNWDRGPTKKLANGMSGPTSSCQSGAGD